jgi:hypothetical protein
MNTADIDWLKRYTKTVYWPLSILVSSLTKELFLPSIIEKYCNINSIYNNSIKIVYFECKLFKVIYTDRKSYQFFLFFYKIKVSDDVSISECLIDMVAYNDDFINYFALLDVFKTMDYENFLSQLVFVSLNS